MLWDSTRRWKTGHVIKLHWKRGVETGGNQSLSLTIFAKTELSWFVKLSFWAGGRTRYSGLAMIQKFAKQSIIVKFQAQRMRGDETDLFKREDSLLVLPQRPHWAPRAARFCQQLSLYKTMLEAIKRQRFLLSNIHFVFNSMISLLDLGANAVYWLKSWL